MVEANPDQEGDFQDIIEGGKYKLALHSNWNELGRLYDRLLRLPSCSIAANQRQFAK